MKRALSGLALGLVLGSGGCQTLIGVEERHLGDDPACVEYCDTVTSACSGGVAVYVSRAECLAVCRLLDKGDPANASATNTLACRMRQAQAAGREPSAVCPLAGPGGGKECGPDCASYCRLLVNACDTRAQGLSEEDCTRQCAALRHGNDFNTDRYQAGDSLECRLYQVTRATLRPKDYCAHAAVAPANPNEPCTDPRDGTPNCEDYCRIVGVACTGENAVYESPEQCRSACDALPLGTNADSGGVTNQTTEFNSIGCRKYHAYSALADPAVHCPHAGPTGDGYCGDENEAICRSYCFVVHKACSSSFGGHFVDDDACLAECRTLGGATEESAEDDNLRYSVSVGVRGGQTVACRMLHAVRAFEHPEAECPIAFGAGECSAPATQ